MKIHFFTLKFIFQFILFSVFVFSFLFFFYRPQYINIFKNEQRIKLDTIKHNIEIKINTIKSDLSIITASIKDDYTEQQILDYLNRIIKLNDSFINIYYCNLLPIKSGGMFINVPKPVPPDFDQTTREWFNTAVKTNEVYISHPYIDVVTKKLAVAFAKAAYNNKNELKGVLGIDFSNMDKVFIDDITNLNYNVNITTESGHYIVHSDNDYILNDKHNLFNSDLMNGIDKDEINFEGNIFILNDGWIYLSRIINADWILIAYGDLNDFKEKFRTFLLPICIIIILMLILQIILFIYFILPLYYCSNKTIS